MMIQLTAYTTQVGYDYTYLILFIGIAILSYIVQANLKSKFEKFSKMPIGMTGRDIAIKMLQDNGIYDVKVTCTPGTLTDHYNPATKTVNLSNGVYSSASIAAAAVAAPVPPLTIGTVGNLSVDKVPEVIFDAA